MITVYRKADCLYTGIYWFRQHPFIVINLLRAHDMLSYVFKTGDTGWALYKNQKVDDTFDRLNRHQWHH